MDNTKLLLLAELPGLEAARRAIDARMEEIRQILTTGGDTFIKPPAILDPTILGRDILGRIKRKRTISPELRDRKIKLIAKARQSRLDKMKHDARDEFEAEAAPNTGLKTKK